jgi:SAM-dependent methyltransferase
MQEELKAFQQNSVLAGERKCLEVFFSSLRGYHLLLLGAHRKLKDLPPHCLHAAGLSPSVSAAENSFSWVQSSYENFAVRDASIDAVIVPYILEYVDNAQKVLKEAHRSLIGEGKLFLFGFEALHPWCWIHAPKSMHTLSLWQVKKLLSDTDFSIEETRHFHYGAIYFIAAQKHLSTATPLRPQWKQTPEIKSVFANANTRNLMENHVNTCH